MPQGSTSQDYDQEPQSTSDHNRTPTIIDTASPEEEVSSVGNSVHTPARFELHYCLLNVALANMAEMCAIHFLVTAHRQFYLFLTTHEQSK